MHESKTGRKEGERNSETHKEKERKSMMKAKVARSNLQHALCSL